MAAEHQVILKTEVDTTQLKTLADQLLALGQITKQQYDTFVQANGKAQESMKKTVAVEKEIDKALQKNRAEAKATSDSFRALTQTIAEEVIKETLVALHEVAEETEQLNEKFKTAKQELRELTNLINNGELTGEELRIAKDRAAELTDRIGDTRDEIRALASDTRTVDLVVEGANAMAAAFTLAQGATALFGEESEDVQKALLKVQAALAISTSAQTLYATATAKGGIATVAYGKALKVVELIQKQFAISSAAAWAAATAGVSLLVAGVAYLVSSMGDAEEASDDLAESYKRQREEVEKLNDEYRNVVGEIDDYTLQLINLNNERLKRLEEITKEAQDSAKKASGSWYDVFVDALFPSAGLAGRSMEFVREYKSNLARIQPEIDAIEEEYRIKRELARQKELERLAEQEATTIAEQAARAERRRQEAIEKARREYMSKTVDDLEKYRLPQKEIEYEIKSLTIKPDEVKMDKVPEVEFKPVVRPKDMEDFLVELGQTYKTYEPYITDIASQIATGVYEINEEKRQQDLDRTLQNLEDRKNAELSAKNLTESQKAVIEKKYRQQEAEAKRRAWIQSQNAKAEEAIINGLLAFTTSLAQQGYPAGLITGGLALLQAGVQASIIKSKPVPAFKKGTPGSEVLPPGMKLVGEEGPELIWTPGKEKIMTAPDTKKLLEKYRIPVSTDHLHATVSQFQTTNTGMSIDYQLLGKTITDNMLNGLDKKPRLNVSIDKQGFTTTLIKGNKKTVLLNNSYNG